MMGSFLPLFEKLPNEKQQEKLEERLQQAQKMNGTMAENWLLPMISIIFWETQSLAMQK